MAKKILIITGDGGESYETWFAVQRFQEEGYEAHVAAPSKRRLHLVMHDFEPGWDTYREAPGYAIESDLTFADVRVADYEAVLCIGGRAPEYLRNDARVLQILREKVKVNDISPADRQLFIDATRPIYKNFEGAIGPELLATAVKELGAG